MAQATRVWPISSLKSPFDPEAIPEVARSMLLKPSLFHHSFTMARFNT